MKKENLKENRYYAQMVKQKSFCTLYYWLATRFNLTMNDVAIFSIIYQYTHYAKSKTYSGSVERLCTFINASKPTVRASLELLHEKAFIKKEIRPIKDTKTGLYKNWVTYTSCINFDRVGWTVEEQIEMELYDRKNNANKRIVNLKD